MTADALRAACRRIPRAPSLAPHRARRWLECGALLALLTGLAALYGTTLFPGIGGRLSYGDSVKWQMMSQITGTVHSPGYPLFLLLLRGWAALLPWVEPALRVTLLAPATALAALALVYACARRLTPSRVGRLLAVAWLGTAGVVWIQATEIEVYGVNLIFVALVTYCFIAWRQTRRGGYFFAGCFVYALSFAHHLTMITLLPALVFIVLATEPRRFRDARTLALVALFISLGFAPYLYLFYLAYTDAPYAEWLGRRPTFSHFLQYIGGGQFTTSLSGVGLRQHLLDSTRRFGREARFNLQWTGLLAGAGAVAALALRQLRARRGTQREDLAPQGFLLLMLAGELGFALYYQITDIEAYYIPVYFALILIIVAQVSRIPLRTWRLACWGVLALALPLNLANYRAFKINFDPKTEQLTYAFNQIPPGSTFYATKEGNFLYTWWMPLEYLRRAQHPERKIALEQEIPPARDFYFLPYHLERVLAEDAFEIEGYVAPLDFERLLALHARDTVILASRGRAAPGLPPWLLNELRRRGWRLDELTADGAFAAVVRGGRVVAQGVGRGVVRLAGKELAGLGIDTVEAAGAEDGDRARICVRGRQAAPDLPGMNVVVLDDGGAVKARYAFNSFAGDRIYPAILHARPKAGAAE